MFEFDSRYLMLIRRKDIIVCPFSIKRLSLFSDTGYLIRALYVESDVRVWNKYMYVMYVCMYFILVTFKYVFVFRLISDI